VSRWLAEDIALDIGAAGCVLTRSGKEHALQARAGNWPAVAAELMALLPARARLSVRVADYWARYLLLEAPAGVAGVRDCRLMLAARFEALYGEAPHDWLLEADWQAGRPMLACALPRILTESLAPLEPRRIVPLLPARWNLHCAALPPTGIWCAVADGLANVLYWRDGCLRLVRQQRGADIDGLLALELTRLGEPVPAGRFWSGDAAPAGWSQLEAR